ncbi:hypothetical protein BJV74DRAFT_884738 [Russula compacta]|nr:hypothetical protein BJV74DRAFT_884738 [Russula compacta]
MAQDDTDPESGLPETISLSISASVAKGHDHSLRSFHAAEKRKIREKNRRHDERLKAQANMRRRRTTTTGKDSLYVENHEVGAGDNEGGNGIDPHLHWRMTRAMGYAEEETGEVDCGSTSGEEWGGIKDANEEDLQVTTDQDVGMLRGEGKEDGDPDTSEWEGDDDEHDDSMDALQSLPSKYLPDHIFVAALSKPKPENDVRQSQTTPKTRSSRKRRSVQTRPKDVVVGWVSIRLNVFFKFLFAPFYESDTFLSTRTVRTLLSSPVSERLQSRGTTLPPARIDKFLANALGLEGKPKRNSTLGSRWQRRPSHLGVLKRTTGAPLTRFARATQH